MGPSPVILPKITLPITGFPVYQKGKHYFLPGATTSTDLARATHEPTGVDGFAPVFAGRISRRSHHHIVAALSLRGQSQIDLNIVSKLIRDEIKVCGVFWCVQRVRSVSAGARHTWKYFEVTY